MYVFPIKVCTVNKIHIFLLRYNACKIKALSWQNCLQKLVMGAYGAQMFKVAVAYSEYSQGFCWVS